jgi:hypothetical protein
MFGLGILVGLGRRLLSGPVADSGLLPASYYRHLALAAMEEEDFPRTLDYLQWAEDPLLTQIFVFRLRLLKSQHQEQLQTLEQWQNRSPSPEQLAKIQALQHQESLALELLTDYEANALKLINGRGPASGCTAARPEP